MFALLRKAIPVGHKHDVSRYIYFSVFYHRVVRLLFFEAKPDYVDAPSFVHARRWDDKVRARIPSLCTAITTLVNGSSRD